MPCVVVGYEDAVEREQLARNLVYLDVCETVLGEPIKNITPHLMAVLSAMRTPFMFGGVIEYKHVAQFLWALHRDFAAKNEKARVKILKRVSAIPIQQCHDEIAAFLDLSFMDAPKGDGPEEKPIAASIAWLIYRFRHNPWRMTENETKHTPIRKLYQELRCWEKEQGETPDNRSDIKKSEWLDELNKALRNGDITQGQLDEWNDQTFKLRHGEITRAQFDAWRADRFKNN